MTLDTSHDPLGSIESRLQAMTVARPSSELWRSVLLAQRPRAMDVARPSLMNRVIPNRYLAGLVAVIALALCAGVLVPSLGKARSIARPVATERPPNVFLKEARIPTAEELAYQSPPAVGLTDSMVRAELADRANVDRSSDAQHFVAGQVTDIAGLGADPRTRSASDAAPNASLTRHVVRKASIDLSAPDVRVAASKAAFLVNEASGEYVEASNIYGQDKQSTAQLTIRVVASRLSEVMGELRGLGTVVSETADGKDVSEQVVDIDARLRNETRVEEELLKLLASRESAPLAEVLELRKEVNASRERIERLTAQRDGLYRLTSLATILINIRYDWKEPEVAAVGWWSTFRTSMSNAGADGLRTLSDAIAFIVWLVLAGLPWWILIAVLALVVRRLWRAGNKARATEPPPAL